MHGYMVVLDHMSHVLLLALTSARTIMTGVPVNRKGCDGAVEGHNRWRQRPGPGENQPRPGWCPQKEEQLLLNAVLERGRICYEVGVGFWG